MAQTDFSPAAFDTAELSTKTDAATAAASTTGQTVTATAAADPATAPAKRRRGNGSRTHTPRPRSADSTSLPPDQRTVSVILPTATYEWFERQAAEAEFEPTLAKYLAWQLRRMEKEQRAEQARQGQAAQAQASSANAVSSLTTGFATE